MVRHLSNFNRNILLHHLNTYLSWILSTIYFTDVDYKGTHEIALVIYVKIINFFKIIVGGIFIAN